MKEFLEIIHRHVCRFLSNDKLFYRAVLLWCIIALLWIIRYTNEVWASDPGFYQYYATQCYEEGTMYPNYSHYYSEYIFAPGWVNLLILFKCIFGNFKLVSYFLGLLSLFNLFLVGKIVYKSSGSLLASRSAMLIYMLVPAFFTYCTTLNTEIPFLFIVLLSTYLALVSKKIVTVIFLGLLIALAWWIRPLAIAWFISALYYFFASFNGVHKKLLLCGLLCLSTLSSLFVVGTITQINFPDRVFQSSTGGVNLIMGAHDKANGYYNREIRNAIFPGLVDTTKTIPVQIDFDHKENRYASSLKVSYKEVDSVYKQKAIDWIKKNPIKWLSMIPRKVYTLFGNTATPLIPTPHNQVEAVLIQMINSYQSFVIVSLFFIFLSCLIYWKKKSRIMVFLLLPQILVIMMTLVCVVMPRYNFIIIPHMIAFSVSTLSSVFYAKNEVIKRS